MSTSELISECEKLQEPPLGDPGHSVCFRSWELLPLLVAVIKNQQRQIEEAVRVIETATNVHSEPDGDEWDKGASAMGRLALSKLSVATELEDVKP